MKVLRRLYTIAILLLLKSSLLSAGKASSLKSAQSALRNLALHAKNNGETACSDDLNEILYYLKIGNENIERTDVNDIIIVIGPSGVGKSTLTQFVANETNKLRAECDDYFGECWIIDESGTIGDDLISKTFLPNLVFHESTQTPFYDMPGFNDNRNESMQIANSFFMQLVLEEAETIKILVLARFSSFETSARLDFPNILRNLVDLIKSPAKFRGGMGLVSTMAPQHLSHDVIIRRNTRFLKESLLENIGELFAGEEEYIRGATEILHNWLESDTEDYFDAKYFSYFLAASQTGPLLDDHLLYDNKKFLDEVIWNRLQFVPKDAGDFGLPMAAEAKLKLKEIGACIFDSLTIQMRNFAEDLENYVQTSLSILINGDGTDHAHMTELLTNLTASDFSFNNMEDQPLSSHLHKLLSEVKNLESPSAEETRKHIQDTLTFTQFIELTKAEVRFEPILWVMNMWPIKDNLITHFAPTATKLFDAAISSLAVESKLIVEVILRPIQSSNDIAAKEVLALSEIVMVKNMFERIASVQLTKKLTEFLDFYMSEYDTLRNCRSCSTIPELNVLNVLQILNDFSWTSKDWISASTSNLQTPLENERDLTIFLRALFIDLSQPNVQTGENSAIYTWWSSQTQLTDANFDDFYFMISSHGFSSPHLFDRSRIKEFIFNTTTDRERLEFLLNFMLSHVYNCTNSSEIIVTGPIISFDRILSRCINNHQSTLSSIILLATHRIYANAKIIG